MKERYFKSDRVSGTRHEVIAIIEDQVKNLRLGSLRINVQREALILFARQILMKGGRRRKVGVVIFRADLAGIRDDANKSSEGIGKKEADSFPFERTTTRILCSVLDKSVDGEVRSRPKVDIKWCGSK